MYLVELRPGKEELYRTGDELAAAIRSGDVDGHSRIYHRATSKWISITLHPQYKAIVSERPAEPKSVLERNSWTYLNAQSETLEGAAPDNPASGEPAADEGSNPWRRPMALSITGLLLVLGVQVSFSGPRPPWSGQGAHVSADVVARPATTPTSSHVVSLASSSAGWERPAPVTETVPETLADSAPAPALPKAPVIRAKSLSAAVSAVTSTGKREKANTVEGLLAGYAAAYDSVRGRLGSGMRVTRLGQLFAPSRLTPNGGLTETRLALAGAANFFRVYRQQETVIERQYQDSFSVLSREQRWSPRVVRMWYSRTALKEPAALASLSGGLLATVDSLLGVLDEQAGAYQLQDGDRIRFEDPQAARRYGELRRHIQATLDSVKAAGGAEPGTPMGYLIQAIGSTRLPAEV